MQQHCGGVVEPRGLIVGGWNDGETEGHYGIRVWISQSDTARLELVIEALQPPTVETSHIPTPTFPVGPHEQRLTPTETMPSTVVTVTCEEHYQDTIEGSRLEPWEGHYWMTVVTLDLATNPHSKRDDQCVRALIGDRPPGS